MITKNQLKVSLIQTDLVWENPEVNLIEFSRKLEQLYHQTNLVILPEMFTTGFSMQPNQLASGIEIYDYLKDHAHKGNYAIYGSVMYSEDDRYMNRGIFMRPDGTATIYDKKHRFTLAGEQDVYECGNNPVMADYLGWKFNLQICYDLRFPVFARNTQDYDVLLYVANWPVPRINAWDALLKARAIENMCYTIGVNRIGIDGNGMNYCGHSQVYNVLGEELIDAPWNTQDIKTVILKKEHITMLRSKLRFLEDRDRFTLI